MGVPPQGRASPGGGIHTKAPTSAPPRLRLRLRGRTAMLTQATRPQTLAYALNDSPVRSAAHGPRVRGAAQRAHPRARARVASRACVQVGLLVWIVDKFHLWSDCAGRVESRCGRLPRGPLRLPRGRLWLPHGRLAALRSPASWRTAHARTHSVLCRFTKDVLLTNVMLYWVPRSIGSSMRLCVPQPAARPAHAAPPLTPCAGADAPRSAGGVSQVQGRKGAADGRLGRADN